MSATQKFTMQRKKNPKCL